MKKIITLCLLIAISCNGTKEDERFSSDKIKIDYYISENTKKLDFPFSDATIVNNIVYISGQVGNFPGTDKVVSGGIGAETKQTMKNIESILTAVGSSMDNIFKCTCMLSDISEWSAMSEEYKKFFNKYKRPSRSAFAGKGLALGAKVEIECWAIK